MQKIGVAQMWTIERQHEFLDCPNDVEMQERMHTDLLALQGLASELPQKVDTRIVVEKGYAIDAACNGKLTRMHYDTDLILATPDISDPAQLYRIVTEVLDDSTGFSWVATQQKRRSWVKFHQAGLRQWDEGVTGTTRDLQLAHQMDVHVVCAVQPFESSEHIDLSPQPGVTYRKPISVAGIRDSYGQCFELTVPTVSDMAATKLRLIRSFDTFYGNQLRQSDVYDFGQLFSSQDFSPDDFFNLLIDYYRSQAIEAHAIALHIIDQLRPLADVVPSGLLKHIGDLAIAER